ncbi:MAG: hypothetical protein WCO84_03225 [bacterium]
MKLESFGEQKGKIREIDTKNPESQKNIEVMKIPEIVFEEDCGAQIFSLIRKAREPEWGETKTEIARETVEYFKENPLGKELKDYLNYLKENGFDEETLYNMALIYKHAERQEAMFDIAKRYKPHIKIPSSEWSKITENFIDELEEFDKSFFSSDLGKKFKSQTENDIQERIKKSEETKKLVRDLIAFFKPDAKTTTTKKLNYMPTDFLYKKNSGRNFRFGNEQLITSHIENVDNQKHEFLHGVINPIVDKLKDVLTIEQKEKISKLAREGLKKDYGENYYSLLCEELIRTFNDVVEKEETPYFENFKIKVENLKENQFQEHLQKDNKFKEGCRGLSIENPEQLKEKVQLFFDNFVKNPLREIIFEIYQKYSRVKDEPSINFENFFLSNFVEFLNKKIK